MTRLGREIESGCGPRESAGCGAVRPSIHRRIAALLCLLGSWLAFASESLGADANYRCVSLELYIRKGKASEDATAALEKLVKERKGLRLRTYNLDEPGKPAERLAQISKYFRLPPPDPPAVYGCNSLISNFRDTASLLRQLESILTINAYVRDGCPHCAELKEFLPKIQPRYPGLKVVYHEITRNPNALREMTKLAERYRKHASSVPALHYCNQLSIGFLGEHITGRQIETELNRWSAACDPTTSAVNPFATGEEFAMVTAPAAETSTATGTAAGTQFESAAEIEAETEASEGVPSFIPDLGRWLAEAHAAEVPPPDDKYDAEDPDALPVPGGGDGPPPPVGDDASAPPIPEDSVDQPTSESQDTMRVPMFGELSRRKLGMPAFTFLVGLVDGFNPCAMWVLLFLLSVLVNLRSRWRILAVAGTFVVISGAAYFAFMAAWLNVFLWIGYLKWVQAVLGTLAIMVGLIHVKDFFAFKKGVSLSIPESAKPGLYARLRRIANAENLWGAIIGASVLAVLVNMIELLCTAGLPAMYTEVLALQRYPRWMNYAYLGLYNLAYMLDDMLMVTGVVVTLGRHKLQENEGRWLKLVSGAAILALGVVMIVKPELLV